MDRHKKPRCLYLATFDPTVTATGTAARGHMFLRYFSERFDTHLVYMKEKHGEGKDEALEKRLASAHSVEYSPWRYFVFSQTLYRLAAEVLEQHECDFVFADFEKAGWYASMLARRYGVPYVYNSHNVEYQRYISVARTNPVRYALVPYMYLIERAACRNALFTVAISEPDAQAFRRWVPAEKVAVLPAAFDEETINPHYTEVEPDHPIVLMVGNYRNAGNRDGAYTAYRDILPRVLDQHPDAIFRFIGKDFPSDIRHLNVQAAGFVDDLLAEYAKATVVIAPITLGGGIKIKVVEALASGKTLVTTEKGMEGIDPSGMPNVHVVELDQFPAAINEAIQKRTPKTTDNWDAIADQYGTRGPLSHLADRIAHVVAH